LRSATLARSWDSSLSRVSACKPHDEHKSHADQHLGVLPWWHLLGGQCLLCFISSIESLLRRVCELGCLMSLMSPTSGPWLGDGTVSDTSQCSC
jgi:undecaprenyl pyrophosphate synthase